jgi:flagellar L-ring protein precursor FlgH
MIHEAELKKKEAPQASPGSLYSPTARFANFTREFRAEAVDDLVTVLVSDKASAVTNGTTNGQRKSSSTASMPTVLGQTLGPLNGLTTTMTGNNQLQAQGTTERDSTLTATVTVRVTHVLPGGNLVVEGMKQVDVNSEHQWVYLRGVIRSKDLTPANTIQSDQVANMELRVNGKGVVNDYVKRPNLLYRILNGILPF